MLAQQAWQKAGQSRDKTWVYLPFRPPRVSLDDSALAYPRQLR